MRLLRNLFADNHRPTFDFEAFMRDIGVPADNLVIIDDELQRRFFQKKPGTQEPLERWELGSISVPCSLPVFHGHLTRCGFVMATRPQRRFYERAGWPGALALRAAARLKDLVQAWESGVHWKENIIFGGQRPLDEQKENFNECCALIGRRELRIEDWEYGRTWVQQKPQTEIDMMRFLWEAIEMPEDLRRLPTMFVDAPMKPPTQEGGPLVRPSTEDPLFKWLESNPTAGAMLVSSGAPYGVAQNEAFWTVLWKRFGQLTDIDTFGHGAPDLEPAAFMREVAGAVHRYRLAYGK